MTSSWVRRPTRAVGAVLAAALLVLAAPVPAYAHGAGAPDGTAYRSAVTAVEPALPGLTVRSVDTGTRLELVNGTGRPVEVLGYAGEPFLEVRPDGAHVNLDSPTAYRAAVVPGDPPPSAGPAAAPRWSRVSDRPAVRWHDERTHWTAAAPPAVTDPTRTHRLRDWVVPLRDGARTLQVRGTLDWVPPPQPWVWWVATVAVAAAVVALRRNRGVVAGLAAAAGTVAVGYAVARTVDAGARGFAAVLLGLLGDPVTGVLAGVGALLAATVVALRRPVADFALALSGAGLAVFAGLANAAVFHHAVAAVPGESWWARVAVLIAIAVGAGTAAAGVLRLRAATRSPAPTG